MLYNHSSIIATFAIVTVLISPSAEVYATAILSMTCQTKVMRGKKIARITWSNLKRDAKK